MKKKSKKLIHLKTDVCVDSAFYRSQFPGENTEEARALIFGSFAESELNPSVREKLMRHLEACSFCKHAWKEFESISDLRLEDSIPSAVCPSSEILDCFLFDKNLLSGVQIEKIESHLQDCELCSEELNWLKDLEKPTQQKPKFSPTWMQSLMAAAAAMVLAISAFLVWQHSTGRVADNELRALAVIQEPSEINYASLIETSDPLNEKMQPLFEQALQAFRTHRFNDARHLLETIRKENPRHAASLYLLAYSYYKLNKPNKAYELCSLSESIQPHSYERCMFLVKIALKTGHFERARLEINTLHHQAPDIPEVKHLYNEIMRLTDKRAL